MKQISTLVRRIEDGDQKVIHGDASLEDIKKEIEDSFSYGNFKIIERTKVVNEEIQGEYEVNQPRIQEGLSEQEIETVHQVGQDLNIKVKDPSIKNEGRSAMYRTGGGGESTVVPPEGYDFEFILDSKNNKNFRDLSKESYKEIIELLEVESDINLKYVASSYTDFDRIRSNRDGKQINVFVIVPREEKFGFLVSDIDHTKISNINNILSPPEIDHSLEKPTPINKKEKIDKDHENIAFIVSNEESTISKNSGEIVRNIVNIKNEEELFNLFGFSKLPGEIIKEIQDEIDLNIELVSGGFIICLGKKEEGTTLKSGVFITKS